MKNFMKVATVGLLALSVMVSANAAPKKPANPKCPVCGMFLASKKTAKSTVAVRLKKHGAVYYCCSHCKMPKSVLVKKGK